MTCVAPGCISVAHAKGMCRAHYMRMWRHGSFDLPVRQKETIADRIAGYVARDPISGCWLWTAAVSTTGYGVLGVNGVRQYAHRLSYEAHVGPIAEGLTIDHLCRTRRCVNPEHLEPVTMAENIRRAATKTHCIRGHSLEEHGYVRPDGGGRFCLRCAAGRREATCAAARERKRREPCEQCGSPVGGRKARRFCERCTELRRAASQAAWRDRQRITKAVLG